MDTKTSQIIELPAGASADKSRGRLLIEIPPTELAVVKAMPHGKRLQWAAAQMRELKRKKKAERKRQRKARRNGR